MISSLRFIPADVFLGGQVEIETGILTSRQDASSPASSS